MLTRPLILAAALAFTATGSWAEGASCHDRSAEKKLAGAAKNSFLTKCEKDAVAACTLSAGDKKLSGAAKTSFTNKCVRDAVGAESTKPH
jgi:hypothetical protein